MTDKQVGVLIDCIRATDDIEWHHIVDDNDNVALCGEDVTLHRWADAPGPGEKECPDCIRISDRMDANEPHEPAKPGLLRSLIARMFR